MKVDAVGPISFIVIAFIAAGFGAVLPGFLEVEGTVSNLTVRAAGSLALFVFIYRVNPPNLVNESLPKPKKPRRRTVPQELIDEDDLGSEKPE